MGKRQANQIVSIPEEKRARKIICRYDDREFTKFQEIHKATNPTPKPQIEYTKESQRNTWIYQTVERQKATKESNTSCARDYQ